jgi:hypothetical protein
VTNVIIPTDPIIAYSTINVACLQLLVVTSQVFVFWCMWSIPCPWPVNDSTFSKLCRLLWAKLLMYCGPCTSLTRNGSQLCRVEIIFKICEKSLVLSCSYLSFVLFSCLKFYAKMRFCILYSIYILIYDVQWICMLIWYVLLLGNLSFSIWLWLILF